MAVTQTGTPVSYAAVGTEASSTFSVTVPSGATKLLVGVGMVGSSAQTISSVTFNGTAMTVAKTQAHTGFTSNVDAIYYLDSPTVTTANVVVTYSGSIRPTCEAFCVTGSATGVGTTAGSTTSMSTSLTAATGTLMVSFANASVNSDVTAITAANGQTVAAQAAHPNGSGGKSGLAYLAGTGSAQTLSWTPTGTPDDQGIVAIVLTAAAVGPTINTQPQSATAITGGNTGLWVDTSKTFTISATTSGGTLHYQWKVNGSNVGSDQNSYTRSGIVIGDNGAAITCVVSDDNGPTTSSTATLTVVAGWNSTAAASPTNASGQSASERTFTTTMLDASKGIRTTSGQAPSLTTTIWPSV